MQFRTAVSVSVTLAMLVSGCSNSGTFPSEPVTAGPRGNLEQCVADPTQIQHLIDQTFAGNSQLSTVQRRWTGILDLTAAGDTARSQQVALDLVDGILAQNRAEPLPGSSGNLTSLLNQVLCYVVLEPTVVDPNNAWVVHVADPTSTFVTTDKSNGIQLPPSGVITNTLVTATPVTTSAFNTLLDRYSTVYEWNLVPAQSLAPGATALIGMCPDPNAFADVPDDALDALLSRLVLGHQQSAESFQLLARVPLPPEMELHCPASPPTNVGSSLGSRLLRTVAEIFLPNRAYARRRAGFVGGVGGSTSEFSPFSPVDPQLYATGGVGGSTSEFVRIGSPAMLAEPEPISGTVGTTRTGPGLPSVTIRTFNGTPIPGIAVDFISRPPATKTPVGNASVCSNEFVTGIDGTARATCINFGTTVQYRVAYTRLESHFTLPDELKGDDADGKSIVTINPVTENWLIASYGPSTLAVTQPGPGHTVLNFSPFHTNLEFPAAVEVRSDLGELVPIATNAVTLALNKNGFAGGSTTPGATPIIGGAGASTTAVIAVNGVASFPVRVPTAANGYRLSASAVLSNVGLVTSVPGNIFDVIFGGP